MNKRTVCYIGRCDFVDSPGGDTTQWRTYERTARDSGFFTTTWFKDGEMPEADVYHALNIDRPQEIYPRLRQVKQRKKPFVLSTIHHPNVWMNRFRRVNPDAGRAAKVLYRSFLGESRSCVESFKEISLLVRQKRLSRIISLWPIWISRVRWLLREADSIALVSRREADFLGEDFGYPWDPAKMAIVPNWVEGISGDAIQVPDCMRSMPEAPILVVGRIEARKNVLRLCRLAERAGRPIIFIGRPNPSESGYAEQFRQCVSQSRFVQWIPGVQREQMAGFYAHSSFLLNASYVEVSPLVDVEALEFGCPVATTRYALHHEYLPEGTPVCDAYEDEDVLRHMSWRPERSGPQSTVNADRCKQDLVVVYARLSGGAPMH
jgi:glycosyltransferase involved in cell wall biosynthesis